LAPVPSFLFRLLKDAQHRGGAVELVEAAAAGTRRHQSLQTSVAQTRLAGSSGGKRRRTSSTSSSISSGNGGAMPPWSDGPGDGGVRVCAISGRLQLRRHYRCVLTPKGISKPQGDEGAEGEAGPFLRQRCPNSAAARLRGPEVQRCCPWLGLPMGEMDWEEPMLDCGSGGRRSSGGDGMVWLELSKNRWRELRSW
ncbi:hypothetical protein BAE44_0023208, partial [Dichanthelium oligosanthes]